MDYSQLLVVTFFWSYTDAYSSCVTPLGRNSHCISIYNCEELSAPFGNKKANLPRYISDFLRESQCGFIGDVPKVCCGPLPEPTHPEDSFPMPRDKCGIHNGDDRIYGGEMTELDEFPWMALLGYRPLDMPRSPVKYEYQCGGVLINHRYVLSAAHCVVGEIETAIGKLSSVRLGEYDLRTDPDCLKTICADMQEISVLHAYPHPGFSDQNSNRIDDISLIQLAYRVNFSNYIKPICLMSNTSLRLDDGDSVLVAGWGMTLSGQRSLVKLKVSLPIFNKTGCDSKYARGNIKLTDKQICAGGLMDKDSCNGDSGGPLMRGVAGIWEAVGIVSFGNGCGKKDWPSVYTFVASYRSWIEETMRLSNI